MTKLDTHWDKIFDNTPNSKLGWYEEDVSQSLKFLEQIPTNESTKVFLPGAGTSILVDKLLSKGYELILNDISDKALDKLKNRIDKNKKTIWVHHDISKPLHNNIPKVDIWIDRAVLHFLLKETDIQGYFNNLQSLIKPGGYVLLAEFSTNGALTCAGLELHRYSIEEMTKRMGPEFKLIKYENYTYTNPSGDPRPYIYALYKRDNY